MKKESFQDLILLENDDYIFINKPPFFSTLKDRHEDADVLSLAKVYWPQAQVCHRLDKETSGVLAIAKHAEAYRYLSIQFEERRVKKIYHAVVEGRHQFDRTKVDLPIFIPTKGLVRIDYNGKSAESYFTTLKEFHHYTLVLCEPITGRTHQLRIHLATLRASIAGDTSYGGRLVYLSSIKRNFNLKKNTEEEPLIKRIALHAFSLQFPMPNGETISIESPYPKDFQALIRQLEKNNKK